MEINYSDVERHRNSLVMESASVVLGQNPRALVLKSSIGIRPTCSRWLLNLVVNYFFQYVFIARLFSILVLFHYSFMLAYI
jgi:hypothetical protein